MPSLFAGLGIAGVIIVVLIVLALIGYIMFRRAYRVAAPNEALIITGGRAKKSTTSTGDIDLESATKVVVGGRAFVKPLFERSHTMDLSSRQIQVEIEAMSSNSIPLVLEGVAQIKVGADIADIRRAAQRFLDQQDDIDKYSRELLSGTMRSAVGTLTVEQILRDRAAFAEKISEDALESMNNQGLVLDTFQIISIEDRDGSYLRDLGRPEAAAAAKRAAIAESQANREATEEQNSNAQLVATSQKELDLRQAEIQQETAARKAEAEAAEKLAQAEQEQRVLAEQQKIADANNDLTERRLVAEVRKPADAAKYESQTKAEAEQYSAQKKADAEQYASQKRAEVDRFTREQSAEAELTEAKNRAEGVRAEGLAHAESTSAQGKADAEATRQHGLAEAESIQAAAEAYEKYNDAAKLNAVLESLPKVAHELVAPYANIDKLSVISAEGESKMTQTASSNLAKTMQMVQESTGLDLGEMLTSLTSKDSQPAAAPTEPAPAGAAAAKPAAASEKSSSAKKSTATRKSAATKRSTALEKRGDSADDAGTDG